MSRGVLVLLLIMGLETAHGIVRGLVLEPRVGERLSSLIGWPVATLLVIVMSTMLIGWTGVSGNGALLRLGALWLVLTLVFEVAVGMLRGLDGHQMWAEINPFSGGLMIYSLIVMLLAPLVAARLRQFLNG